MFAWLTKPVFIRSKYIRALSWEWVGYYIVINVFTLHPSVIYTNLIVYIPFSGE